MIGAAVVINLRSPDADEQFSRDRRALLTLDRVPDGARVVVDIGGRKLVSQYLAEILHGHGDRLHIEIQGTDPDAVARFVRAARSGSWEAAL